MRVRDWVLVAVLFGWRAVAGTVPVWKQVEEGNKLFKEGKYEAAQQVYATAQVDAPESAEIAFNLGTTFYRQGKYEEALRAFEKALGSEDVGLVAKAHYNIGNALVQQGKLREALEAYKRCLELTRDDEDAKYNIEYVQRKLKELASKQKEEQEKDPLHRLLKELEKLIGLQARQVVETRALQREGGRVQEVLEGLQTNEARYAGKAGELAEGFRDLRTNLPPEQLMQGAGRGAGGQGVAEERGTRELLKVFEAMASVAKPMNEVVRGGDHSLASNALVSARERLKDIGQAAADELSRQFADAGRETLQKLEEALREPGKLEEAGKAYDSLMENLQRELGERMKQGGVRGGTEAAGKTLGEKIEKAIGHLERAYTNLSRAAELLRGEWTNAIPVQVEGLEDLIRARKEFEDEEQQQQQEQGQRGGGGGEGKKEKKEQEKGGGEGNERDRKEGEQKQKQEQQRGQGQEGGVQREKGEREGGRGRREEQPQMTAEQVEQILRAFGEDQRNQQRARWQRLQQGYVPVDKDW
ncbi:MAG: tetratricopeptide repeat protein [bacterium]|nr:tetratricopeptide repeat protein [bacterium]